jgi:hypothetical protein
MELASRGGPLILPSREGSLIGALCLRRGSQVRQQCCQAGGPQGLVVLAHLAAQPLDGPDSVVADAVDWEEDHVGATDEAGQQRRIVFDASVMVKEARARALDDGARLRNLAGPASNMEDGPSGEVPGELRARSEGSHELSSALAAHHVAAGGCPLHLELDAVEPGEPVGRQHLGDRPGLEIVSRPQERDLVGNRKRMLRLVR